MILNGPRNREDLEKIDAVMKPRGYVLVSHDTWFTDFRFVNPNTGLMAIVKVDQHNEVSVKLWFLCNTGCITVQTPEFAIDHPRFSDLFETKMLEIKAKLES